MPDGALKAIIHAAQGRGGTREFPVQSIEAYTFDTSMDNDADSFSIDIGDPRRALSTCTDRDTEVRTTIFNRDTRNRLVPVFSGIADTAQYSTDDSVLSIRGRDMSILALGDAPPGRWRHVQPAIWIKQRALSLGMQINRIHRMAEISTLYADGTETDWALWYRMVRSRGMFMWVEPLGGLVIDHLAYELEPSYFFGQPPRGGNRSAWVMPDSVVEISSKDRNRQVWVYAQDDKSGKLFAAKGIDTTIRSWRRKPLKIISSSTAKSQADAKKEADVEVFESIVAKQEYQITVNDSGLTYKQNKMCRVNLPDHDIVGDFYIVGVTSSGSSADGKSQTLRLREKGFAVSKRVPSAPQIAKDPGNSAVTSQVGAAIRVAGVRWGDSFVRATNEFKGGWDTAVFLGALLAICQQESGFHNVAEQRHQEWMSWSDWLDAHGGETSQTRGGAQTALRRSWEEAFANAQSNSLNPRYPSSESGVGPMQLTTPLYKQWADQYGWDTGPKVGEYDGGRWNPDSNIRAAARALIGKGDIAPRVDPTQAENIWILVSRYHGSKDPANNAAYVASVKSIYKNQFASLATAAVTSASKKNVGLERSYQINGYGTLKLAGGAPDAVVKAINFCMNRRGDRYLWGGFGPLYDCSGLVTAAYESADPQLDAVLAGRGETTYTLWKPGRFKAVLRDQLLPGDLVFFHHGGNTPEHVGMYLDDNLFVNDSSSAPPPIGGVKINSLSESYFAERYMGARRLVTWLSAHPVP